jgi:cytochrome c-type biogenesis protein CcmH/NrfG
MRRSTVAGVVLMALLLVLYLVLLGQRAVLFVASGQPIAIVIGICLFVLPLLGLWALVREVIFGVRSAQLVGRLDAEGGLPVDDLPRRASGRPIREAADEQFPIYKAKVEDHPDDWRNWLLLGLAYDASGDRRRARQAVRNAIALSRSAAEGASRG